jgi:hypothetical protein
MLALNETKRTVLASRLRVAGAPAAQRKDQIRPGDGVWIESCRQIDTSTMRFSLDLVFLDEGHTVVAVVPNLKQGMECPEVAGAAGVLEVAVGTAMLTHTQTGDRILIEPVGG